MKGVIRVRGARQNNLKNLDVDLPRGALTVVTGPSGSGKSSLARDTLFAEGQRRYVESLSTYAKQFLERREKPDVDRVDGIPPAVAIEQTNPTKSSRSTVGTATEVYDYMRLLWARVGRVYCPTCDSEVRPDTPSDVVDAIGGRERGTRLMIGFPLHTGDRVSADRVVENLLAKGFMRLWTADRVLDLSDSGPETREALRAAIGSPDVHVVVDRITVGKTGRDRLADSVETAFREGEGNLGLLGPEGEVSRFTERFRCAEHVDLVFETPTPKLFSFNSPYGSCTACSGFGAVLEYDEDLIVPNPDRAIVDGAVDPWTKPRYRAERRLLRAYAGDSGVSTHTPWKRLPAAFRRAVLHGSEDFQGVIPFLVSREKKKYKQYIRVFLRQYQRPFQCPECGGSRIRKEARYVRVGGRTIDAVAEWPLTALSRWVDEIELTDMEAEIAATILRELRARVRFLDEVGLGYLALSRQTRTLSGGEAQRITLANSLGSRLVDTLYVLDEPTVGLHPADTHAMLGLLVQLRDTGNTVVVVEHDSDAIRAADRVIELGPGSGDHGGSLVFEGGPDELLRAETATGRYLSGRAPVPVPARRRRVDREGLELRGAELHNLRGVDIDVPLGALTVVTGVSGSGKSTLVRDILFRALEQELRGGDVTAKQHLGEPVGAYTSLAGHARLDDVVLVDQSPIGRTPRSNPVTYIKAWSDIRSIFAREPLAREREYGPRHFSFNVEGGRCEHCKGAGQIAVEMLFMADVYLTCEACGGRRFKREILDVEVGGLNVAQVLELTVDQAIRFFLKEDRLGQALWHLQQVGLGYLRLGQPAPTLSGGEAQRLKIARELAAARRKAKSRRAGSKLYLLDEPTTGLSGQDVGRLLGVLSKLLDAGHTVVVIEHNLDVIKTADWVIDMGPGAGQGGGSVVAMGRPEDVAGVPESLTGRFLADVLTPSAVG